MMSCSSSSRSGAQLEQPGLDQIDQLLGRLAAGGVV
jgi:hypothetical protein